MHRIQTLGVGLLILVVAVLTATAIPSLAGEHLHGNRLLVHMMASGGLVIGLPILSLVLLGRMLSPGPDTSLGFRLGWLASVATGLVTMASVFACMLPIASTETMHQLVSVHGYAGFAMVPATVLLAAGFWKVRRMQSTR